ncbi:MAG: collagen-like protein [Nitrospirae bacterium]|nr:MAG: collagen-like protein [Nitrospirota bacterium]
MKKLMKGYIGSAVMVTLLVFMAMGRAWGDATYSSDGNIHLYMVDVPGSGMYDAYLKATDSTGLEFVLTSAQEVAPGPGIAAKFTGETGILSIPKLAMNGVSNDTKYVDVDLELIPGSDPMKFKVKGVYGLQVGVDDRGPMGPRGLKGDTGATGPQGIQGVAGPMGLQGPIGLPGPTGATGATGATGPQGIQGAAGPQGPIGLTGATGPQGIQGVAGPTGATGATGAVGISQYEYFEVSVPCTNALCSGQANCSAGKSVLGGGVWRPGGGVLGNNLHASYPHNTWVGFPPDHWHGDVQNMDWFEITFKVWVICAVVN